MHTSQRYKNKTIKSNKRTIKIIRIRKVSALAPYYMRAYIHKIFPFIESKCCKAVFVSMICVYICGCICMLLLEF